MTHTDIIHHLSISLKGTNEKMSTKIYEAIVSAGELKALFELADENLFPVNPTGRDFEKAAFVFSALRDIADRLADQLDELEEELSGSEPGILKAM